MATLDPPGYAIRESIPPLAGDCVLTPDIEAATALVREGVLAELARAFADQPAGVAQP